MDGEVKYRIGWVSALFVTCIAIVADLLQVLFSLLVVTAPADDIVTVVAEGFIFFYFILRGVKFMRGKRSLSRFLGWFFTTIIELVPFLDALPTLTLDTWYTIHSVRAEDRENFKEQQARQAEAAAQQAAEEDAQIRAYYLQQQAANDNEEDFEEEYEEAA